MGRGLRVLLTVLTVCFLSSGVVWAQAVSQITGSVKDQTGAVLPGADITATQTDTGVARMAISDETGSFVLPSLPLGPYRLEVSLPGFRTFVQTGINLEVNSTPVINAVLEVGQVSEQVEVQANAVMVETRSTGIGQMMENQRILELPLNGRQVTRQDTTAEPTTAVTATTRQRTFPSAEVRRQASRIRWTAPVTGTISTVRTCRCPSRMHCRNSNWKRVPCRRSTVAREPSTPSPNPEPTICTAACSSFSVTVT
jgi:hypothetical protein